MVFAIGLGVLASLAFFVSANVYAYAASLVARLLAAWLVEDRNRGIRGVLLGIVSAYAVWGTYAVIQQLNSCGYSCGGMSSPTLTAVVAIAFGLIGLALAAAGFVVGRVLRRIAGGRAQRSAS